MSVRIYFYASLMAIQQLKRQSDLEKRLKLLHKQIYGNNQSSSFSGTHSYELSDKKQQKSDSSSTSDLVYLHQDLLKIFILATFAIGAQIILFYLVQHNLLRINFL